MVLNFSNEIFLRVGSHVLLFYVLGLKEKGFVSWRFVKLGFHHC